MAYPGLNKTETEWFESHYKKIHLNLKSDREENEAFRHEIFFGKKRVTLIRYWFDRMPGIKLTDEEIKELRKKYLNTTKSADWTIARDLIKYQRQLSGKEVMEIYNSLSDLNKPTITQTVLGDSRISDTDRKELIDVLFNQGNFHYYIGLLRILDQELSNFEAKDVWKDGLRKVIDEINSGSSKGQIFLDNWISEMTIAQYVVEEMGLSSTPLYELTGNESFLPKEAKDLFLF